MSSKSSQRPKKLSVPRELDEITKEYNQRVFALGQAQYQRSLFDAEIKQLTSRVQDLNQEAFSRKTLDGQKATPEVSTQFGASNE